MPDRARDVTVDLGGTETPTHGSWVGGRAGEALGELGPGDTIGPYAIGEPLGEGGMGKVFTARHRELDRDVALKLIRPEHASAAGDELAQARLLREAQAMARLDHPNIVTVFDAGSWRGTVYLAMERITGTTLKMWLAKHARSWREIRDAFVKAGGGLAAAHAAGIVHRDFKPANVLVGDDGRIRVTDFGLARDATVDLEPASLQAASVISRDLETTPNALSTPLTSAGAVMGTPGYMSPEQALGESGDARADQYSFCVSLYDALYRERPYAAKLGPAVGDSVRPPPKGRRVPRFLRRALLRGLAIDPDARFPGMHELLAAIARDPMRRLARWLGGAALVIGLVAAFAIVRTRRGHDLVVGCESSAGLDGIWDDNARRALASAFETAGKPAALRNTGPVTAAIDRYAKAWTELRAATCTRASAGSADPTVYLTLACLAERRTELATLVAVLVHPDPDVAVTALDTVSRLSRPNRCSDPRALAQDPKPPSDPKTASDVEAVRSDLMRAHAKFYTSHATEELDELAVLERRADKTGYKPLQAEVLYEIGLVRANTTGNDAAFDALNRAESLAEAGGADQKAGLTAAWLAGLETSRGHGDSARQWLDRARILLERIGGDPDLESQIEQSAAAIDSNEGRYDSATEHQRKAVALLEASRGLDDQWTLNSLNGLAGMLGSQQRFAEALVMTRKAIPALERVLGADNSKATDALITQSALEEAMGDYTAADRDIERARGVARRAEGTDSIWYVETLNQIADLRYEQGRGEDGLIVVREDESIIARTAADSSQQVAAQNAHARLSLLVGDYATAIDYERKAVALSDKLASDPTIIGEMKAELGVALLRTHRAADAVISLEQAIPQLSRSYPSWEDLGIARFTLARALSELHRDPERALALVREARSDLAHVPWRTADISDVASWLHDHHAE